MAPKKVTPEQVSASASATPASVADVAAAVSAAAPSTTSTTGLTKKPASKKTTAPKAKAVKAVVEPVAPLAEEKVEVESDVAPESPKKRRTSKKSDQQQPGTNLCKSGLIKLVATETDMKLADVKSIVDKVFSTIVSRVAAGDKVSVDDFGIWTVKVRKERNGVNPQTQARIVIPAKRVAGFAPSKSFKESVAGDSASASASDAADADEVGEVVGGSDSP